jgi:hypothetical protein
MACFYYDLNISFTDTSNATGNIIFLNDVVYVGYTDCDLVNQTVTYDAGTWIDTICADDNYPITFTYYKDDLAYQATNSTGTPQGTCGTPPSPTPTSSTSIRWWWTAGSGSG